MSAKKAQHVRDMLLVVGFVIAIAGVYIHDALVTIGWIMMFSCIIVDFLFNKCPHCGKHLGKSAGRYCQHCGGKVEE